MVRWNWDYAKGKSITFNAVVITVIKNLDLSEWEGSAIYVWVVDGVRGGGVWVLVVWSGGMRGRTKSDRE